MLKEIIKKCNNINANTVGVAPLVDMKIKNVNNKSIVNAVGADATFRPLFREHTKNTPAANSNPNSKIQILTSDHKAITLVALIITIIVMLILVGVTVNVALDGGLFEKAKKATYLTEISEIQEQLEVEKAIKIAENGGNVPEKYNFTFEDLDISSKLKNKYKDKLSISDGNLYYNDTVTNSTEQSWLNEMNVTKSSKTDNTSHAIHVGDKWTNVTFSNLPEKKPEITKNIMVFIEDKEHDLLWILWYAKDSGCLSIGDTLMVDIIGTDKNYAYQYRWETYEDYENVNSWFKMDPDGLDYDR